MRKIERVDFKLSARDGDGRLAFVESDREHNRSILREGVEGIACFDITPTHADTYRMMRKLLMVWEVEAVQNCLNPQEDFYHAELYEDGSWNILIKIAPMWVPHAVIRIRPLWTTKRIEGTHIARALKSIGQDVFHEIHKRNAKAFHSRYEFEYFTR